MFSQWFQPHETIHLSKVMTDVEFIAIDTLKNLKKSNPDHPIFKKEGINNQKGIVNQIQTLSFGLKSTLKKR